MQVDNTSFKVWKTKNGVGFWEVLPFNPVLYGWTFKEACCCNVKFTKGDMLMSVTDKGNTYVKYPEKTVSFTTPTNQLELLILDYGTTTNSLVCKLESVENTHSH